MEFVLDDSISHYYCDVKIIKYRSNKNFCNNSFRHQLLEHLNKSFIRVSDLAKCNTCVLEVLNKEALIKKKFVKANEAPFMTRKLKKVIMVRLRVRNTFLKHPTSENKKIMGNKEIFVSVY